MLFTDILTVGLSNSISGIAYITVKDWLALSDCVLGSNFYHHCIKINNIESYLAPKQLLD